MVDLFRATVFWLIQCWRLYLFFLNWDISKETLQLAFLTFGDAVIFKVSPMGKCMKTMQKHGLPGRIFPRISWLVQAARVFADAARPGLGGWFTWPAMFV